MVFFSYHISLYGVGDGLIHVSALDMLVNVNDPLHERGSKIDSIELTFFYSY